MSESRNTLMVFYSVIILLGAFLLFLVQPLIGKIVTPQYGGSAQIWCLCLMFFQVTLVLGYGITYAMNRLSLKKQGWLYLGLLTLSMFLFQIPTGSAWQPANPDDPVGSLLLKLFSYVAIPVVLLSTVSTMFQNWYQAQSPKNPYILYSISNVGSFAALFAYPFLIEPVTTIPQAISGWTMAYWGFAALGCCAALMLVRSGNLTEKKEEKAQDIDVPSSPKGHVLAWLCFSAAGTFLLLSTTHTITHDIAPVPLLWVIPLALYLLTFILCFSNTGLYKRDIFIFLCHVLFLANMFPMDGGTRLVLTLGLFFFFCMVCHGELYNLRPAPRYLSRFYFLVAVGGALGGIFVNLVAPALLHTYAENTWILILLIIVSLLVLRYNQEPLFATLRMERLYVIGLTLALCFWGYNTLKPDPSEVVSLRNVYGVTEVAFIKQARRVQLHNGTTLHGFEFYDEKKKEFQYFPTSYFGNNSAVAIANHALRHHRKGQPLKIGVIGLGAGTIAYYNHKGETMTFYEIDPKVKKIAEKYFSFIRDARGKVNIKMGDARLTLEKQKPQQYDMLVIDAFTSDAIPFHLLTREALQLYLKHVKPDGLIVFHVSNRYLNLKQVIHNLARDSALKENSLEDVTLINPSANTMETSSIYTVVSPSSWFEKSLQDPGLWREHFQDSPAEIVEMKEPLPGVGVWTDNYSNLFSVFMKDDSKSITTRPLMPSAQNHP